MPTRDTAWPAGTPCWIDYGAADLDAARAFYTDVLGWTYTGGNPEFGGYLTCLAKDRVAAGMAPQMDPSDPPRWTTYFASDDAAAHAARITELGGTVVVPPMEVGPMGSMAIALDPQGNPFGLWQAAQQTGVMIYNEPGALVWNDAALDDPEAGKAFYGAVFGFDFTEMEGMAGYATFARGGDPLGGIGGQQDPASPKGWATCFAVSSTDDAVASVEKGGGTITMAAQDTTWGRLASLQDPWGAVFSVMEVAPG
jgi:predicted enzyme related to lactoylglutathione lyase